MGTREQNTDIDGGLTVAHANKVRELAREQHQEDGQCEIDDNAVLSLDSLEDADRNEGCYVQAWVWVEFTKQELPADGPVAASAEGAVVFRPVGVPT